MWITQEPNLDALRQTQSDSKSRYMHGSIAAQRLGISSHLLSRITGSIYVMQGPREQLESPKRNLGLNLKFNKKNEEVGGFENVLCISSTSRNGTINLLMRDPSF